MREHGFPQMAAEAKAATLLGLDQALAAYLPDIQLHFAKLFR
jgi:hypothetical protein